MVKLTIEFALGKTGTAGRGCVNLTTTDSLVERCNIGGFIVEDGGRREREEKSGDANIAFLREVCFLFFFKR